VQDPFEKRVPGLGLGRDPERTPMQWDDSAIAGFSAGANVKPWLPLAEDFPTCNVAVQRGDPASMLSLYKRLIELRRAEPALNIGSYEHGPGSGDVFAYTRRDPESGRAFFVALNFGPSAAEVAMQCAGRVALSTHLDRVDERVTATLKLRGDEGLIVALDR
jgi:alpha-glucosidase